MYTTKATDAMTSEMNTVPSTLQTTMTTVEETMLCQGQGEEMREEEGEGEEMGRDQPDVPTDL